MFRRRSGLVILLCLIVISFFGVLAFSTSMFPKGYDWRYRIRRFHEFLARSSAGFLAIGMLGGCWCAWKGSGRALPRSLFWIWSAVTVLPLTGVICSEALLLVSRFYPRFSHPIRHALRHSVFWHLGFWEWIGAVAVFVFLCAATFLIPAPEGLRTREVR